MTGRRVIVIGAGPVGLEAALAAAARGYDVTVLEKDAVGANLRRWGSTRLFSPVRMNVSARARRILGPACPPEEALLTGPEMVERILEPLARSEVRDDARTTWLAWLREAPLKRTLDR